MSSLSIGERIRHWRKLSEFSQQVLADAAGCSQGDISGYEKSRWIPRLHTLMRICAALGVTMEQFFCGFSEEELWTVERIKPRLDPTKTKTRKYLKNQTSFLGEQDDQLP